MVGKEFTHAQLEHYFELLLLRGAGIRESRLSDYSIHSFRIFVACALLALGVPRAIIKRHLRWRGDESLDIYARLNDSEWQQHVFCTYSAEVNSTIAGRLASIGHLDLEQVAPIIAQLDD